MDKECRYCCLTRSSSTASTISYVAATFVPPLDVLKAEQFREDACDNGISLGTDLLEVFKRLWPRFSRQHPKIHGGPFVCRCRIDAAKKTVY